MYKSDLNQLVIRSSELSTIVGLSRSTLAEIQRPGSKRFDPSFPPKVRLGERAVGWLYAEIIDWLKQRQLMTVANPSNVQAIKKGEQ